MAPIYSQKLVNALFSVPISGAQYTVPASTLVVVTDFDLWVYQNPAGAFIQGFIGAAIVLWDQPAAISSTALQWRGRQVLNTGDTISAFSTAAFTSLAVTGYVLSV